MQKYKYNFIIGGRNLENTDVNDTFSIGILFLS